jgi:CheY-like chemotaxis protein
MSQQELTSDHSASASVQILIVEDDPGVLGAMRRLLKLEGYRVLGASSVAEALSLLRQSNDVRLLITDFHLANGELGTDAIETIRAACGTPLKAVLITGDTSCAMRDFLLDDRVWLITKPINANDFLALLSELLAETETSPR